MTKPGDSPATNWEEKYKKEHKLRQEAEGEMSILKTISVHSSPEMRKANAQIKELHNSLERFKKENNECYNRIADLTESLKSKDYFKDPDYKFLVEENLNLRRRITELEQEILEVKADNMKMARQVDDQIAKLRKAGLL